MVKPENLPAVIDALWTDLDMAREEIGRQRATIDHMIERHASEMGKLKDEIAQLQARRWAGKKPRVFNELEERVSLFAYDLSLLYRKIEHLEHPDRQTPSAGFSLVSRDGELVPPVPKDHH